MKLYTEAEIISAYEKAELCHLRLESFIELMTPIELPSELTALNEHLGWLKEALQNVIYEGYSESWIYAYQLAIKNAESTIKKYTHENNN